MTSPRFFVLVGLGLGVAACSGRLDVGDQDDGSEERIATARAPSIVALGTGHACAVLEDATVACWGFNRFGQTGVAPTESLDPNGDPYINTPTRVPGLENIVQVSAGWQSSYAVRADGKVFGWGATTWTPDALAVDRPSAVPHEVPGVADIVKVADGGGPVCALRRDGAVLCWGGNVAYNAGGTKVEGETNGFGAIAPNLIAGITDAIDITISDSMTCAIHRDGDVSCWGRVQLVADEYTRGNPVPVKIPGVHKAVEVAIAQTAAIALLEDGTVMGWGESDDQTPILGQIHGPRDPRVTSYDDGVPPAVFPGLTGIASIRAQYRTMCALVAADGSVRCWGRNDVGELGQGQPTKPVPEPTRVEGVVAAQLEVGTWNACFIDAERRLLCWGEGGSGALGTGSQETFVAKASTPVLLPAPLARSEAR